MTDNAVILSKSAQKDDEMEQRLIVPRCLVGARNSTVKAEPVLRSELMKWDYTGIGGEEAVPQKQMLRGPVTYMISDPPKYCKLLAQGCERARKLTSRRWTGSG